MNRPSRWIVGVSAAVLMSNPALADKVAFSTFVEPGHIITRFQTIGWADAVRKASNGGIDFEIFSGGALLPALGTLQGVADGVAQAGIFPAAYVPSQLPTINALGDMGFLKPDPWVMGFAFTDFVMHEPVAYAEWRKNGVIYGAGHGTPALHFLCRDEVHSLEDMLGKRIRVPGGGWARVVTDLGMVPVNVPASETYTVMERGSVDCMGGDPTGLTSGPTLMELVKSVMMLPLTPAYTTGAIIYNPVFWKSLTNEQRRLLLDETARATVRLQIAYDQEVAQALEEARKQGVLLVQPDEALQKAYDDWVANGVGGMAQIAKEKYGIEEPEKLFALFQTYISKWEKLLEDADRSDEDAMTALVKANLFDRVDVSTYGME